MSIIHLFEGQDVRFVGTWENPEWIAADVCEILGIQNVSQAVGDFDEDEAGICTVLIRSENGVEQSRQMLTVKEQGLYQLISVSRKPEAKRFKKWMFGEVLPSIRKTGSYSLNQPKLLSFNDLSPLQVLFLLGCLNVKSEEEIEDGLLGNFCITQEEAIELKASIDPIYFEIEISQDAKSNWSGKAIYSIAKEEVPKGLSKGKASILDLFSYPDGSNSLLGDLLAQNVELQAKEDLDLYHYAGYRDKINIEAGLQVDLALEALQLARIAAGVDQQQLSD